MSKAKEEYEFYSKIVQEYPSEILVEYLIELAQTIKTLEDQNNEMLEFLIELVKDNKIDYYMSNTYENKIVTKIEKMTGKTIEKVLKDE